MSYVQADLIREALAELEVLDASNTVASEDSTKVTARLNGIVGDLIQRRFVASLSLSAIPDEIFPALVTITAQRCAELYGKPLDQKRLDEAEDRLREITRLSRAGTSALTNLVLERLEAVGAGSDAIDSAAIGNYITTVLADLSARGVVTIANEAAISTAQFPHVVTCLAAKVSGFPALLAQVAEAEAKLREADRLSATGTALVQAVLHRLEALGAGSDAVNATTVAGLIQTTLDDLKASRIVSIANEAAISSGQFQPLVTIVAAKARPSAVPPEAVNAAEDVLLEADRLNRATGTALAQAVLERLASLGALTDAIDLTAVTAAIQRALDDLSATRIITLANDAAVLSKHFPHVVTLVAALCAPKAVPAQAIADAKDALGGIARLDRTASTPLIRGVLQQLYVWSNGSMAIDATAVSDSFTGIFASLSARNVIYIADATTVPDSALPALTRLVAAWLAPKPMGDVIMQAERELRTLQRIGRGTGAMLKVDSALIPRRRLF